ncbi:MAG: GNAT family N-acetyltransferase [Rouxiella aceris]|jgi:ribosomal protein S18 acetylase RimI-like enzyme|uniref:GNAT family N-acetyltransferase n=1 Tax=Rouxiella aceris TaxID=2703884 RepID=A0A848MKB2_9GAMM|nr:GNAT family N-acetyltransferase [Rouxiella aceris]MDR3431632.1 GNAT family N-acetyltransferase [Rouxiella aceris]NMP28938.1 GNAT family N-acetyltransferase [Rouxiella aceris]
MLIRQANLQDMDILQQTGRNTYRHYFAHLWQNQAELEQFLDHDFSLACMRESFNDPQQYWLLAYDNQQLLGFAKTVFNQPIPQREQLGAKLSKLYLLPAQRAKGVGGQLYSHLAQAAQHRHQAFIWLEVLKSNTSAQRFYQKKGMQVIGQTTYVTSTQGTDILYMGTSLS